MLALILKRSIKLLGARFVVDLVKSKKEEGRRKRGSKGRKERKEEKCQSQTEF
jgi:hypothetical protein